MIFALHLLGLLLLVALPGWLTLRALKDRLPSQMSAGETLFAACAIGFLIVSWLAITLVEIGRFSPRWFGLLLGAYCISVVARQWVTEGSLRGLLPRIPSRSGWLSLSPFLFAGALLLAVEHPFEWVLGGRDPGVYVNAGVLMSRFGGLPFHDPQVDLLAPEARSLFLGMHDSHGVTTTERLQGFWYPGNSPDRLVPQGMHLFPAWIGIGNWILGYPDLLWVVPFIGMLSILAFYHFVVRSVGRFPAGIAAMLLAFSPVQIYFSRYPDSELLVQALLWSALYFFQLFVDDDRPAAGGIAGLALGLTLLTRIDSVLVIVPVCLIAAYYLLLRPARLRPTALLVVFACLALQAALHVGFIARPYVLAVIGAMKMVTLLTQVALPGFLVLVLSLYLLRKWVRSAFARWSESRALAAAFPCVVLIAAAYLYFYRPQHPGGEWDLGNANSFRYFVAFLGIPASLAFVAGAALFAHRSKGRNILLSLLVATHLGFYLYRLQILPELIWAMRRFVPVIWPAAFFFIAVLIAELWRRQVGRGLAILLTAALAWHAATAAPRYARLDEYKGAIEWVDNVARLIGPNDVVIFEPRFNSSLQTLSLPLWSIHGRNVFQLIWGNPDPQVFSRFVDDWRTRRGGRVLLAIQNGVQFASTSYGGRLVATRNVSLPLLEQVNNGIPRETIRFDVPLRLYELVPIAREQSDMVDIGGGSDDLLVSAFSMPERGEGNITFRWSSYRSGIFLPGFDSQVEQIEVRLTQGPRPESLGRASCVLYLNGTRIGVCWPAPDFQTYRFDVPPGIRTLSAAGEPVSLALRASAFVPASCIPGNHDTRILGVAVDWVRLVRRAAPSSSGNEPSKVP